MVLMDSPCTAPFLSQHATHHSTLFQVVFDMDGTLTEGHIDFADMRQRTRGCLIDRVTGPTGAWVDISHRILLI